MVTRIAMPRPGSPRPAADVSTSLPGHSAPAAGFEEPFDMLSACHERVERMLALLQRLLAHLDHSGWDASAAEAAQDVMRYFDLAAPLHHQDEELHVFPILLAAPDTTGMLHGHIRRLQQDHRDMETGWPLARAVLQRIREPGPGPWQPLGTDELHTLQVFEGRYQQHMDIEEQHIYPATRQHISPAQHTAMALDMMQRRGVRLPARD